MGSKIMYENMSRMAAAVQSNILCNSDYKSNFHLVRKERRAGHRLQMISGAVI